MIQEGRGRPAPLGQVWVENPRLTSAVRPHTQNLIKDKIKRWIPAQKHYRKDNIKIIPQPVGSQEFLFNIHDLNPNGVWCPFSAARPHTSNKLTVIVLSPYKETKLYWRYVQTRFR